ncbi:hypothetical protein BDF22DRAFT_739074 [Syncephalis plumigaleata]|nr:hypothetical protein BDF22DRAFT_739074 [Syncephalis plumigaleata]
MVFVSVLVDLVRATRHERISDHSSPGTSLSTAGSSIHDHSSVADNAARGGASSSSSSSSSSIMNMTTNQFQQRGRWRDRFDASEHLHHQSLSSSPSSSPTLGNINLSVSDTFHSSNDSGSGYTSSTSSDGHSSSRSRSPSPGAGNGHGANREWWIGATMADGRRRFYRVRSRSPSPDKR